MTKFRKIDYMEDLESKEIPKESKETPEESKETPKETKETKIKILRDGVFVADGEKKNKGDIVEGVGPSIVDDLVARGFARVVQ